MTQERLPTPEQRSFDAWWRDYSGPNFRQVALDAWNAALATPSESGESITVEQAHKMAAAEYLRGLEDAAALCEGKRGVWPLDVDGYRDSEWGERYARCIRDLNPEPQRG